VSEGRGALVRAILADGGAPEAGPPPADAVEWLAGLSLLRGVPFEAIVPHPQLLPEESIRFFAVDPNWIDALLDGALAVAHACRIDRALTQAVDADVRAAAIARARERRERPEGSGEAAWSGFLLRSAVVTDFPGLSVRGWSASGPLPLLRCEAVAPSVLLALFDGELVRAEVAKPAQLLHFGFALGARDTLLVELRATGGDAIGRGVGQLELAPEPPLLRPGGRRVLDVAELRRRIEGELGAALTPGALALQLVAAAEAQPFAGSGRA
jgi:hypothetical protein